MKEYVVGFMFSVDDSHVLLIEKQKPEWQKGMINDVGGKVEKGETTIEAMKREFKEEVGLEKIFWESYCTLMGAHWKVHFFKSSGNVKDAKQTEIEKPIVCKVRDLPKNVISNLNWLIPLALDSDIRVMAFSN